MKYSKLLTVLFGLHQLTFTAGQGSNSTNTLLTWVGLAPDSDGAFTAWNLSIFQIDSLNQPSLQELVKVTAQEAYKNFTTSETPWLKNNTSLVLQTNGTKLHQDFHLKFLPNQQAFVWTDGSDNTKFLYLTSISSKKTFIWHEIGVFGTVDSWDIDWNQGLLFIASNNMIGLLKLNKTKAGCEADNENFVAHAFSDSQIVVDAVNRNLWFLATETRKLYSISYKFADVGNWADETAIFESQPFEVAGKMTQGIHFYRNNIFTFTDEAGSQKRLWSRDLVTSNSNIESEVFDAPPESKLYLMWTGEEKSRQECQYCGGVCTPFGLCIKTDGGCDRAEVEPEDPLILEARGLEGDLLSQSQLVPAGPAITSMILICKRRTRTKPVDSVELCKNGLPIEEGIDILRYKSDSHETSWMIPVLRPEQTGSYTCRRKTQDEHPSSPLSIQVHSKQKLKPISILKTKPQNIELRDNIEDWPKSGAYAVDETGSCEIVKATAEMKCFENENKMAPIPLPETESFVKASSFSMKKSGNLVFWCHSPNGFLWLTNLETKATSQVRRLPFCEQLSIDWSQWVAVYLSSERKISSLRLNDTSDVYPREAEVEVDSIAVDPVKSLVYWLTVEGVIKEIAYNLATRFNRVDGTDELQKASGNIRRHSLFYDNGRIGWITEYFGKFSYIDVFNFTHVDRYLMEKHVRSVYVEQRIEEARNCSRCGQICQPYLEEHRCACAWNLAVRTNGTEVECKEKIVHVLAAKNSSLDILSFELGEQKLSSIPMSVEGRTPVVLMSTDANPSMSCYLTATGDRFCENDWESRKFGPKKLPSNSKILGAFEDGSQFHVVYYNGTCIRLISTANRLPAETERPKQTMNRTLFCSNEISRENHIIDFSNWIVFWQNKNPTSGDVYRTDVASRVNRHLIPHGLFQSESTDGGRMAIDSKNRILYWIRNNVLRSVGYDETPSAEPMFHIGITSPRQLTFADGFLYWIETVVEKDRIVLFDLDLKAKWVLHTSQGQKLPTFSVQSEDGAVRGNSSWGQTPTLETPVCTLNSQNEQICWCPEERPLMVPSVGPGSPLICKQPKIYVALASKDGPKGNYFLVSSDPKVPPINATADFSLFTDSKSRRCWLQNNKEEATKVICNKTTKIGFAHKNPVISLNLDGTELLFNKANVSDGMFTLSKTTDGAEQRHRLDLHPIRMQPGVQIAVDHRRKLVIWCDNIDKRIILKPFDGESTDIRDPKFEDEASRCLLDDVNGGRPRILDAGCTSIAVDDVHGIAYFIDGTRIRRLDYTTLESASTKPEIGTVHRITGYTKAHSLQYYFGYLFWVGGYEDPGEFVESVKIVSQGTSTSMKVYAAGPKSQILQIQVHREYIEAPSIESPCETSSACQYFCIPQNWWSLKGGASCYCPTGANHAASCKHLKGAPLPPTDETPAPSPEATSEWILYVCIAGGCIFAIGATAVTVIYVVQSRKANPQASYEEAVTLFVDGNADAATRAKDEAEKSYYMPFQQKIEPEDLRINADRKLGEGNFGAVFLGIYKELEVAIKVVKAGAPQEQLVEFLKELKIMAYIGNHGNIVSFFGADISQLKKGGVLVVLELSPHGDLETYLRKNRKNYNNGTVLQSQSENQYESGPAITFDRLTSWAHQVAQGMAYLEEKQVVHGDLATRNVLLFENDVAKVSDFGFSRKTYGQQYTKENKYTPLPYRWAAPETLELMVFSTQTDVWSYGVTVWEIFTLGNCPFVHEVWDITFAIRLREGMRLEKPELATGEIYDRLMMWCWQSEPEDRPTFQQVCRVWDDLLGGLGTSQSAAQFGTLPSVKPVAKAVQNSYAVRTENEVQDMSKFFKDGLELNFARKRP